MTRAVRSRAVSLSLDSFLDIVTNVAGVLILVAVVTVLSAGDVSLSLGTPILQPAPKGAERVLFECRNQRVSRVPEAEVNAALERLSKERGAQMEAADIERALAGASLRDAEYRVRFRVAPGGAPVWLYEPRYPLQGETSEELKRPSSEYRRHLKQLNSKTRFLFFLVREDSFDVFREARKIGHAVGLAVGWYPKRIAEPLAFSSGGTIGAEIQ